MKKFSLAMRSKCSVTTSATDKTNEEYDVEKSFHTSIAQTKKFSNSETLNYQTPSVHPLK